MGSTDSSSGSQQQPQLPPGFRFHPTDEELVVHYLKKKAAAAPLPVTIIAEVDLYKFDPWELPGKANFGDQEWYFFSPRDRKYPNGARPNRAATSGYWKATGTDKPIMASVGAQKVGVKKALVFYGGKPPKGIKTNWIMHEYRLADSTPKRHPGATGLPKGGSLRLDDWVLCRIYKKNSSNGNNGSPTLRSIDREDSMERMLATPPSAINNPRSQLPNPRATATGTNNTYSSLLDNEDAFMEDLFSDPATMASKRALASPFWSDTGGTMGMPPPAKRFNGGGASTSSVTNNHNNSSSSNSSTNNNNVTTSQTIAMLLNQIPPDTHNYQQSAAILGSLGVDGSTAVYRQPFQLSGANWSA